MNILGLFRCCRLERKTNLCRFRCRNLDREIIRSRRLLFYKHWPSYRFQTCSRTLTCYPAYLKGYTKGTRRAVLSRNMSIIDKNLFDFVFGCRLIKRWCPWAICRDISRLGRKERLQGQRNRIRPVCCYRVPGISNIRLDQILYKLWPFDISVSLGFWV